MSLPILKQLLRFSAAGFLLHVLHAGVAVAIPQKDRHYEDLHGVLSRQPLKPPLRNAEVALRYSPDGHSLMVQNPSGIYLLSREPLRLRTYLAAEEVYPARFSFDSQDITVIGHGLTLGREKLPGGPRVEERELPFHDGCLDAELAPGADFLACLMPDLKLVVYRLSTNQKIFSESLASTYSPYQIMLIPLDPDVAFSSPLGFRLADNWDSMAGKGKKFLSIDFSPDAKILLASNGREAISVDLAAGRKTALPGSLHKRLHDSFCLQDDGRVLIGSGEKEAEPVMMSLKSGEVLANPSFKADTVHLARNPRYALLSDAGMPGLRVFDLVDNRELDAPENVSIDIFGNEMAVLNDRGTLFLYHVGEQLPFLSADLPLDSLPVLRAAAVSPSLDLFAFSVDGNGAAFQVGTGERIYSGPRFSATIFSDQPSASLLLPRNSNTPTHVVQLALNSGKTSATWSGGKDHLHSGGTVLLEYALGNPMRHGFDATQENDVAYRLFALDPVTGKELWERDFFQNSPVPFADPQGERLVLAWNAKSSGADAAAKRIRSAWEIFKHAKLSKLDTYFEIVDASSGKTIGGALVQQGSGPYSFEAAFSVGDALFLVKDGKRVSVHSLQDGRSLARLVGVIPAANAQSNLFAIEEGPGLLVFYDLATAAKLGQHIFPDSIAYTHFSGDGNHLFVLTKHQVAYILDVNAIRSAPPAASSSAPH